MENEKTFQTKESKQELTPGQKLKLEYLDGEELLIKQIRTRTLNKEGIKSIIDRAVEKRLLRTFENREDRLKVEASDFAAKLELGIKNKNLAPEDFPEAVNTAITEFRAIKPTTTENYGLEEKIQAERERKLWGFIFKPDKTSEPGYYLKRTKRDKDETPEISKIKWHIFNACQKAAEAFQTPEYQRELEKNRKEGKTRRPFWGLSSFEFEGRMIGLPPHYLLKEKGLDDLRPARSFFRTLKESIQFLKSPEQKALNQYLTEKGFFSILEFEKEDEKKEYKKERLFEALKNAENLGFVKPAKPTEEEKEQLRQQRELIEFWVFDFDKISRQPIRDKMCWQFVENPDSKQNSINREIFKKINWYRRQVIEKEKAAREKREAGQERKTGPSGMSQREERAIWETYLKEGVPEESGTPGLIGEKMKEEGLTPEKLFHEKKKEKRKPTGETSKGWGEKEKRGKKGEKIEGEELEDEKSAAADKKEEGVEKETKTSTPSIPKEEKGGVSLGEIIDIKKKIEEKKKGGEKKKKEKR